MFNAFLENHFDLISLVFKIEALRMVSSVEFKVDFVLCLDYHVNFIGSSF